MLESGPQQLYGKVPSMGTTLWSQTPLPQQGKNNWLSKKAKSHVKSGCFLGNLNHAFMSASAKRMIANEKDALILQICRLNLYFADLNVTSALSSIGVWSLKTKSWDVLFVELSHIKLFKYTIRCELCHRCGPSLHTQSWSGIKWGSTRLLY